MCVRIYSRSTTAIAAIFSLFFKSPSRFRAAIGSKAPAREVLIGRRNSNFAALLSRTDDLRGSIGWEGAVPPCFDLRARVGRSPD